MGLIILPSQYDYRMLIPVAKNDWRVPSQAQPKDQFGNENVTQFRLIARLNDGYIVWRGWFDDREDAAAFLFALAVGSLEHEPALWDLPVPSWCPGFGENISYEFATQVFVVSGTSFNAPSDWNSTTNTIELIAGGASGANSVGTAGHFTGGGGGAWAKLNNFAMTPSASINCVIGAGGTSVTTSAVGNNGTDTWLNKTTNAAPTVVTNGGLAKAGLGGNTGTGSQNGGAGGASLSCVGNDHTSGGRGGNLTGASGTADSGGGGAAGASASGNTGVDSSSTSNVATNGGQGDGVAGGTGGTGSAGTGGNGSPGTEWDGSHGSGGGGGAGGPSGTTAAGGGGGLYGAGGGGAVGTSGSTSGAGAQGIIVLTYTGATISSSLFTLVGLH